MACSVCKQVGHNSQSCRNKKQAFIDQYDNRWDEAHQYLVGAVKAAIDFTMEDKPDDMSEDIWRIWKTMHDPLASHYGYIRDKVKYHLDCSPLEAAVWRYYQLNNVFWEDIGQKAHTNTIFEYVKSASDAEKEAYLKLRRLTWEQVCLEYEKMTIGKD